MMIQFVRLSAVRSAIAIISCIGSNIAAGYQNIGVCISNRCSLTFHKCLLELIAFFFFLSVSCFKTCSCVWYGILSFAYTYNLVKGDLSFCRTVALSLRMNHYKH